MVTDFGIAKVRDDTDLTSTGTMLGTVKYLAPEQVESRPVDARTDVYALGVVLYEALVGRAPFVGDTAAATALARLHQTPASPRSYRSDVPPALDAVVMRALARDPNHRFGSASEMRAALLAPAASAQPAPVAVAADHDVTTIAAPPAGDPTTWGPPPPRPAPFRAPVPAAAPAPPRRRDWLLPTLLVLLIGGSIGLAVALVARTQSSGDPTASSGNPAGAVTISSINAFDPLGDGHEHDNEARLAIDGEPATAWHTETYSAPDFGTKPGVGLVITLDRATTWISCASLHRRRAGRPTCTSRMTLRRRSTVGVRRSRRPPTSAAIPRSRFTARTAAPCCCGSPASATPRTAPRSTNCRSRPERSPDARRLRTGRCRARR